MSVVEGNKAGLKPAATVTRKAFYLLGYAGFDYALRREQKFLVPYIVFQPVSAPFNYRAEGRKNLNKTKENRAETNRAKRGI